MRHSFRHDRDPHQDVVDSSSTRTVGRSPLTQRHVARMSDEDRAADHARRDAAWSGVIQRKESPTEGLTAGPSEDDRHGAGAGFDIRGRIAGIMTVGSRRSELRIMVGAKHGVRPNMTGYIVEGAGMLQEFVVDKVTEDRTIAYVDLERDQIVGHTHVVINPTTRPGLAAPRTNMRARIVGITRTGERTRLVIGYGEKHGARWGMPGYVAGGDGRPFEEFKLEEVDLTKSIAYVSASVDQIRAYPTVVLNPG